MWPSCRRRRRATNHDPEVRGNGRGPGQAARLARAFAVSYLDYRRAVLGRLGRRSSKVADVRRPALRDLIRLEVGNVVPDHLTQAWPRSRPTPCAMPSWPSSWGRGAGDGLRSGCGVAPQSRGPPSGATRRRPPFRVEGRTARAGFLPGPAPGASRPAAPRLLELVERRYSDSIRWRAATARRRSPPSVVILRTQ